MLLKSLKIFERNNNEIKEKTSKKKNRRGSI